MLDPTPRTWTFVVVSVVPRAAWGDKYLVILDPTTLACSTFIIVANCRNCASGNIGICHSWRDNPHRSKTSAKMPSHSAVAPAPRWRANWMDKSRWRTIVARVTQGWEIRRGKRDGLFLPSRIVKQMRSRVQSALSQGSSKPFLLILKPCNELRQKTIRGMNGI